MIKKVLLQCHELDRIGVDKEEMHRPFKHILVKNDKPVLIDFERAHMTKKPKNVTQFIQYLISSRLTNILKKKGAAVNRAKAIKAAKEYRKTMSIKAVEQALV